MPIEASDGEMDSVMLGIESRTIGKEMPKKLEKMLIQRSTVKRKKDSVLQVDLSSCIHLHHVPCR